MLFDINKFSKLLKFATLASWKTSGKPCDEVQEIFSGYLVRQVIIALSLNQLFNGTNISDILPTLRPGGIIIPSSMNTNAKVYDQISAFALCRCLFDGFISMSYLRDNFTEDVDFAIMYFRYHSIRERIRGLTALSSTHPQLIRFKQEKDDLGKNIKNHSRFLAMSSSEKKQISRATNYSRLKRRQLAINAGIHESHYDSFYRMASSHMHGNPASIEQNAAIRNVKYSKYFLDLIIDWSTIYLGLSLSIISAFMNEVKQDIESDSYIRDIIKKCEKYKGLDLTAWPTASSGSVEKGKTI